MLFPHKPHSAWWEMGKHPQKSAELVTFILGGSPARAGPGREAAGPRAAGSRCHTRTGGSVFHSAGLQRAEEVLNFHTDGHK